MEDQKGVVEVGAQVMIKGMGFVEQPRRRLACDRGPKGVSAED